MADKKVDPVIENTDITQIRIYNEDKEYFVGNSELEKKLLLKYAEKHGVAKKQEDLMHLVRLELEEHFNEKPIIKK